MDQARCGGGDGGLEGLMQGLRLSEEERSRVRGARRREGEAGEQAPQAVGKLFANRPGHAEGIALTLGKIWCPGHGIRCKELGQNLFLFTFLQPGGKRRAILEGPWDFGGDLLVVTEFDGSKRLKDLEFTHIPVWIRVFDLPLRMMDRENGLLIGDRVGRSVMVDVDADGSAVGGYLRIKVKIDIRRPLMRGIMVENEDGGADCWCPIRYGFIPNFCYGCGRLGHVEKDCDSCEETAGGKQFGDWLRITPNRWKGGNDQRNRWLEGGSGGSGKSGRTRENGKQMLSREQGLVPPASLKSSVCLDLELKDGGTSPVMKKDSVVRDKGTQPRTLVVQDSGKTVEKQSDEGKERVVHEVQDGHDTENSRVLQDSVLATGQVKEVASDGNTTREGEDQNLVGERDMEVDATHVSCVVENEDKQVLAATTHVGGERNLEEYKGGEKEAKTQAGHGVRRSTFRRLHKVPSQPVGIEQPNTERKRRLEEGDGGEQVDPKKRRPQELGDLIDSMDEAGLRSQPCWDQ